MTPTSPDLSTWSGPSHALAVRILAFIEGSLAGTPPEPFEQLALAVHAFQSAHCPVRRKLIEGPVTTLEQIPVVPVALFKDLRVGTVRDHELAATFLTSGTTVGRRGAHRLRSLALYDHGALAWARRFVGPLPARTVNLLLDPSLHPESSLSHMVDLFARDSSWHLDDRVDIDGFLAALDDRPAFIGATAFALAELLRCSPPPLPAGSTLMVTGGFKGLQVHLDDDALYRAATEQLRPQRILTEYGMTELSSQLWGTPGEPYRPPPWLRVVAIDPVTEAVLPPGQAGQLRFIDLCNLDASVAIETLDQGSLTGDGCVILHGRLPSSPARGCSLSVEESWRSR